MKSQISSASENKRHPLRVATAGDGPASSSSYMAFPEKLVFLAAPDQGACPEAGYRVAGAGCGAAYGGSDRLTPSNAYDHGKPDRRPIAGPRPMPLSPGEKAVVIGHDWARPSALEPGRLARRHVSARWPACPCPISRRKRKVRVHRRRGARFFNDPGPCSSTSSISRTKGRRGQAGSRPGRDNPQVLLAISRRCAGGRQHGDRTRAWRHAAASACRASPMPLPWLSPRMSPIMTPSSASPAFSRPLNR